MENKKNQLKRLIFNYLKDGYKLDELEDVFTEEEYKLYISHYYKYPIDEKDIVMKLVADDEYSDPISGLNNNFKDWEEFWQKYYNNEEFHHLYSIAEILFKENQKLFLCQKKIDAIRLILS